jgi:rSAM/selenodomain-associated transferase 1
MNKCLIIFTRYPEPGKTKTRMIPDLGKEGAAKLQRYLTESTIQKGKLLQEQENYRLQVYFSGGSHPLMVNWLGEDLDYICQSEGDLGERMKNAFADVFQQNISQAILIGTDCPELTVSLLSEAGKALNDHDLVLGKASDGGYYLIGLSRLIPPLFAHITWGSDQVFRQTQAIAEGLRLSIFYLKVLDDLDRPEDLKRSVISDLPFKYY